MNPTGQPFQPPYMQQQPPPTGDARQALNVPGILLIVFGALGVLNGLWGLVSSGGSEQLATMLNDPNIPPALKSFGASMAGGVGKGFNLVAILLDGLVIFGAVQMRNLKNYPLALTAAIIATTPCGPCCCVLTIPVGIWCLVLLFKPEVKSQFS